MAEKGWTRIIVEKPFGKVNHIATYNKVLFVLFYM